MKEEIASRLASLRKAMQEQVLDAVIIPSTDPHASEYVPDYWKTREWISGFNGSAGTAVITMDKAALWTDSRYFLQAGEQLSGTEFQLMKERLPETPSIADWLGSVLPEDSSVGIDEWVYSVADTEQLRSELKPYGHSLCTDFTLPEGLWNNRPPLPDGPVCIQPLIYAGRSCKEKLSLLRDELRARNVEGLLVPVLDDIAWTLNIRCNDIHCNPVAVSYLLITQSDATLFIQSEKLTPEVIEYLLEEGVKTLSYKEIEHALRTYPHASIWIDSARTNYALWNCVRPDVDIYTGEASPIAKMKMIKNEAEIAGFHQAMLRAGKETEMSIDRQLLAFRAEQPLFKGISFDTIAGYKEHGAIVHYEATPETDVPLKTEGLLLLDSGAQYQDGTTDITRTIALGTLTEEEKRDYTLVLKAHIGLSRAKFPKGTCGTQLAALAHAELWKEGLNYMHGTGHGVGSYLNVHEGPHQIRMNYVPTPLQPGMTVTDEPGLYKAGRHGIRTENTLLVTPYKETEFGEFYQFEPLTLCPIDTTPLIPEMLTKEGMEWLNDYHQTVYERLAPHLDEEHRQGLLSKLRA